jgi:glutathione peroxidase
MMELYDIEAHRLDGEPVSLADYRGTVLLIVNVASQCGLTPQYAGLERLQGRFGDRGFAVLGFPCNQFGGQEPGDAEQIAAFCAANYSVSFPLFEKNDVNGPDRQPVYQVLTRAADAEGEAGDIQWNFEKFVVSADGRVAHRFRPRTDPESPEVVAAIEAELAG